MATASVQRIAGGDLGAQQTLQRMRDVVNHSLRDPVIIETARGIAAQAPPRDLLGIVRAIYDYLQDHFQFVPDPRGVETLATPRYLLDRIERHSFAEGDCDDAAILAAALGKAVGLRAKYRAVGFAAPNGPLTHVYTLLHAGGRWVRLDPTKPLSRPIPPAARAYEVAV
ncbi:MAG: transglutaminase domain-containing protein [Egibacteraceae bacterium]